MVLRLFALSLEVGLDFVGGDEFSVLVGCVDGIRPENLGLGPEERSCEPYRRLEPCTLVEVVKAKVLDEAYPVHH